MEESAKKDAPPDVDAKPGVQQPEIMGEICIPEKEVPIPEPAKPEDKPTEEDGSTVSTEGKASEKPEKPAKSVIIEHEFIEVEGPALLGIVCPPDQLICPPDRLKPEEPKALDPHREGSPG